MKVIVLDRDGVINEPRPPFLRGPEDWVPLPGAIEAISLLTQWGWRVVLAINQSAIGRGLVPVDTMNAIHDRMIKKAAEAGGRIAAIFFCPHAEEQRCDCRKPQPGMLRAITQRFGVDPARVPVVGDRLRDLQAAAAIGAQPWLVRTGFGAQTEQESGAELPPGTRIVADLMAVAQALIAESTQRR
jgi:D-glycero-D-manno-heptose 1,7-bisphosphate phosphatase